MKLNDQLGEAYYKLSFQDPLICSMVKWRYVGMDHVLPAVEIEEQMLAVAFLMVYQELLAYREAALKMQQFTTVPSFTIDKMGNPAESG